MTARRMGGWRRLQLIALGSAATLVILALAGFLFAASGLYSIAASRGHFAVTRWVLEFVMRRSVATHTYGITTPPLHSDDLVRLGAAHFQGGCAPCHGAPGQPGNFVFGSMLPSPPNLSHAVSTWSARELFWIVKNGIKYTGMPAWVAHGRDDEVWAVIAFLRRLPDMDPVQYRLLAGGQTERPAFKSGHDLARDGRASAMLTACARCHVETPEAPASRLVPKLAGQSAVYLAAALGDYIKGLRSSGVMQPIAAELQPDDISALASYYANLTPRRHSSEPEASAEEIARGRTIATEGIRANGIPPCRTCHVSGSAAVFPRLAGQHRPYLAGQLRVWRKGLRDRTARGAIMAVIARRLDEQQIDDVAAYFASIAPAAVPQSAADRNTPERLP